MNNITNKDLKLLKSCRAEITRGDRSLVNLLISRMNNAILIGRVKKKACEPIVQPMIESTLNGVLINRIAERFKALENLNLGMRNALLRLLQRIQD